MRRYAGRSLLRIVGKPYATGLEDLLAELNTVSTSSNSSAKVTSQTPKLRRVVRTTPKVTGENQPTRGGTEMLNEALKSMKELEGNLSEMEKKKSTLLARVATDSESEKEGVAFPSARLPMSSQEVRLEGGEQEFRPSKNEVATEVPPQGTVAHATVIGRVARAPVLLEDSNGLFIEFEAVYSIPFEAPMEVRIVVRGYGDLFIHYCQANLREGSVVHSSGWLMPLPDGRNSIVCLPMGGNITVVKG